MQKEAGQVEEEVGCVGGGGQDLRRGGLKKMKPKLPIH